VSIAPLGFPENRRQEGELVGSPVATPWEQCPSQQCLAVPSSLWPLAQPSLRSRQMNTACGTFTL
jgi:hypothetical protein